MKYIICFGNPLDGFEYIGTFNTVQEANGYANLWLNAFDWWIVMLQQPTQEET